MSVLRMALAAILAGIGLAAGGCGDDGASDGPGASEAPGASGRAPGGAPANEASPEAQAPAAVEEAPLPPADEAAVRAAVEAYVAALNSGDGSAVCALAAPEAIPLTELPIRADGCAAALDASIGQTGRGGAPAWKRTRILEVTAVSVGPERARVTATVMHRFSDRGYRSVEEDVIYLDRIGGRWLLAQPSGTLYRAVGYPEPPLRALTPPG
jgi:ketosteroid isomerase-like protein